MKSDMLTFYGEAALRVAKPILQFHIRGVKMRKGVVFFEGKKIISRILAMRRSIHILQMNGLRRNDDAMKN